MPAKAGIQWHEHSITKADWIPACAGTTESSTREDVEVGFGAFGERLQVIAAFEN